MGRGYDGPSGSVFASRGEWARRRARGSAAPAAMLVRILDASRNEVKSFSARRVAELHHRSAPAKRHWEATVLGRAVSPCLEPAPSLLELPLGPRPAFIE